MSRELHDLDWWIRQTLRDTNDPKRTLEIMEAALAQNAVELGYIEHADGTWRFAGEWTWGPGITVVEKVPHDAIWDQRR